MLDQMLKNIYKRSSILAILTVLFILSFTENQKENILGYIFGWLVCSLTFKLLFNSSKQSMKMNPASAKSYTNKQYFIRFGIYFVVLAVAATADYISVMTTFFGLMTVKIVIVVSTVFKWDL